MKKFAKLSLVAAVAVAGLTTAQADTLAEAFAASKIKGEIRAQYFAEDYDTAAQPAKKDSKIYVAGGSLGITTGSFYGLTAGATFYTSHVLDKDDTNADASTATADGITKKDEDASGSVLTEAYLAYTLANTTAKVGRQTLATPLLASSGTRMIKDSYEAALLVNTDIPGTTVAAGYVDKYAARTDELGNTGKFDQFGNGAYTVLASNKSVENLELTGQYVYWDNNGNNTNENITFLEAAYKIGPVKVSGEYVGSDNGKATDSNGSLYGAKVQGDVVGINLTGAYTTTDKEAKVIRGYGEGAYPSYTKLTVGSGLNSYEADTNSYLATASYKIADVTLGAGYALYDLNATDTKKDEREISVAYAFNKNASVSASQTYFGKDDTKTAETRVNVSYKF